MLKPRVLVLWDKIYILLNLILLYLKFWIEVLAWSKKKEQKLISMKGRLITYVDSRKI